MLEGEFGTFPASQVFPSSPRKRINATAEQQLLTNQFCMVMDSLEDDPVPRTAEKRNDLAVFLREFPEIVTQVSVGDELATVLHHLAAAGPAKDKRLFELVVQLGGNEITFAGNKDKAIHYCIKQDEMH